LILDFEKSVNNWWNDLKNVGVEQSLSQQLERLEMGLACETALEELKSQSIQVLGGEYLFWELEEKQAYDDQKWHEYTSLRSVILAVAPISFRSTTIEVDIGNIPAAQVEDSWHTWVNGLQIDPTERNSLLSLFKIKPSSGSLRPPKDSPRSG
jgi:hypothetical protein